MLLSSQGIEVSRDWMVYIFLKLSSTFPCLYLSVPIHLLPLCSSQSPPPPPLYLFSICFSVSTSASLRCWPAYHHTTTFYHLSFHYTHMSVRSSTICDFIPPRPQKPPCKALNAQLSLPVPLTFSQRLFTLDLGYPALWRYNCQLPDQSGGWYYWYPFDTVVKQASPPPPPPPLFTCELPCPVLKPSRLWCLLLPLNVRTTLTSIINSATHPMGS